MTTRTIYFDKSGFTGYNLLDPAQPIFVVASAAIDEKRAAEILSEAFPGYQGPESSLRTFGTGSIGPDSSVSSPTCQRSKTLPSFI